MERRLRKLVRKQKDCGIVYLPKDLIGKRIEVVYDSKDMSLVGGYYKEDLPNETKS